MTLLLFTVLHIPGDLTPCSSNLLEISRNGPELVAETSQWDFLLFKLEDDTRLSREVIRVSSMVLTLCHSLRCFLISANLLSPFSHNKHFDTLSSIFLSVDILTQVFANLKGSCKKEMCFKNGNFYGACF